ncbi:serine/threonine-protein kinase [Polymorphobacter fuscus]|uniref:Protein kinase n=1 Tax=Sandarakinorhabdus fusca TaxID=1439888 RepID=A0A7C9KHQ7_9SPHN|nr:serine/threonine-protein kinase [Polymorphobacter fuscus]KAB7647432.1 serine/threonine protein kinase [Polymorphobacter fuscus]MQT16681.1 protein kinase [Polymorphobacter fuscus]NJC09334.1 serine/threonine-protein kinase [Polymorphobacter fuscus]
MTDQREARALAVLEAVLDRPMAERAAYARDRCGDDAELLARVLRLLAADDAGRLRTGTAARAVADAPVPDRIGQYRITGLIGVGGMGAVYRGERDSGDFHHVVAIKLIRPGALSDQLVARFARERQTLAGLAHPHIARLFDGGQTPAGAPYIVMEYVDGQRLDDWLATAPTHADRIGLFIAVCAAVGFAHQNLVIHRDLTPSNILVDATGAPKLIDFGIARPPAAASAASASPSSSGAPARSPSEALSLTPGFAAPERVAGLPATTLSDIYSLGAIFARMFDAGDPDRDAIVARSCAESPDDRYPSADALADDVRAWHAGAAVAARGGGRRYRFAKFVRRHRLGVGVGVAALLLLVAALGVTSWSYARAEAARVAEARRFAELRSLAGYLIFDLNARLARIPGNTTARANLAEQAQRYLDGLAASGDPAPDLRLETARGRIALARVQGVPAQPTLGDDRAAAANLAAAEALLAPLPAGALVSRLRAEILADRALLAVLEDKDPKAATTLTTAALATLDTVPVATRDADWHKARRAARHTVLEIANQQADAKAMAAGARQLRADRLQWPALLRNGVDGAVEQAWADYYEGVSHAYDETGDRGTPILARSHAGFAAAEAQRPGDPALLYMMAWSGLDGFAAASQAGDAPAAARLIAAAKGAVDRLRVREDRDDSVVSLDHSIGEAWAQHLGNLGRFRESVAAQQQVVDREKARIAQIVAKGGAPLGVDLAFSEMILGIAAKQAGDRTLACASWQSAAARYDRVAALGKLTDFHAGFRPGLARNLALCAAGRPVSAFGPMR